MTEPDTGQNTATESQERESPGIDDAKALSSSSPSVSGFLMIDVDDDSNEENNPAAFLDAIRDGERRVTTGACSSAVRNMAEPKIRSLACE